MYMYMYVYMHVCIYVCIYSVCEYKRLKQMYILLMCISTSKIK